VSPPFPFLPPEQVSFTQAQLEVCEAEHEAAVFGCPVCFVRLAEKEPYAELSILALEQALNSGGVGTDEESLKYARALLADAGAIASRVRKHLRQPEPGGAE
jgi:hypothetical protein